MNEKERIQRAYENMLNERAEEKTIDRYLSSLDSIEEINDIIDEKWAKEVDIKSTGEHAGKTVAQIKKEIEALKGKAGNKEKMGELLFALRSKTGWKKGKGAAGLKEEVNEAQLTRKHFTALAELMKRAKTLDHLKSDIIQWLAAHNPNFNEELFRQAAGAYIPPKKQKEDKR